MLTAGRQIAHERADAVTAVGQHRDRLIRWQPLTPQHLAEPALRCGILAADQAEVAVIPILGHRLANDDLELLPLVMPVPEVATVDPDNDRFLRDRRWLVSGGTVIPQARLAGAEVGVLPGGGGRHRPAQAGVEAGGDGGRDTGAAGVVTAAPVGAGAATAIHDVSMLTAAERQQVRALQGLGAKSEERILQALAKGFGPEPERRGLLGQGLPVVREVVDALRAHPAAVDVSAAGSVRRGRETFRDLDVIATAGDAAALIGHFVDEARRSGASWSDDRLRASPCPPAIRCCRPATRWPTT